MLLRGSTVTPQQRYGDRCRVVNVSSDRRFQGGWEHVLHKTNDPFRENEAGVMTAMFNRTHPVFTARAPTTQEHDGGVAKRPAQTTEYIMNY